MRRSPALKSRNRLPRRLGIETLESRETPTVSAISAAFNGTKIAAGNTIWFNSSAQLSGLGSSQVTLHVENGSIDFTAGGTPYHLAVPNAEIVITPGATAAAISFDPTDNDWDTSAPAKGAGDVFLTGLALPVQNDLPGGIKNVSWQANIWSDTAGVTVNWSWAAAVYKNFTGDYNAVGVKPVDSKDLSAYRNGDQSGAPEAFKAAVIGGGTGGGGTNYTGNFSASKGVKASLGDGMSDYPFPSSNPLTSVAFNESSVLRAANLDLTNNAFQVWYNDEHALALGVGQVVVKTAAGSTTTNYPITPLTSNPGVVLTPSVGSTATAGDQAGTDLSGRPMAPSLFITDITANPNSRSGDWQYGGAALAPSAVFGSWKSFSRTVDYTTGTATVSVNTSVDPVKNNWNLGAGSDAPPAALANEGYGAEMRWDLNALQAKGVLVPGHNYRFYVMVHDGDQNKVGGDAGQASFQYYYPGTVVESSASLSGTVLLDAVNPDTGRGDHRIGAGDPGLDGVAVDLLDACGCVIATTTTANGGTYRFDNVPAGTYSVRMNVTDSTYANMYPHAGSTGGSIDMYWTGFTDITLKAGYAGTGYDMGLWNRNA